MNQASDTYSDANTFSQNAIMKGSDCIVEGSIKGMWRHGQKLLVRLPPPPSSLVFSVGLLSKYGPSGTV